METVSKRLKELRESAGYSPAEFALMFGISRSSVYRYEGGNVKESREIPISLALVGCGDTVTPEKVDP
ncbi:MAG TPA: helix-turn-helix transcriptional regulator, partial [Bacillota bacterium]|nr:helix-turn-helix transcriptional regulator [Bacillota bacterium]